MDKETLRSIQLKSLEILLYFKDFCEKHGLLFYFCGGCCIGAIRHKGFIPWDDDIDLFMPRGDYEKLAELWPKYADTSRYTYGRTTKDNYTRIILASICDENTTFILKRQKDLENVHHGIRIEILPLDGCPSSRMKRRFQKMWALLFTLYNTGEPPVSKGKAVNLAGKILLFFAPTYKFRCKLWRFCEKKMSQYPFSESEKVTELCARWRYMVNEYPREAFDSAVYKEFEGHMMPVPKGYDTYLKMAFGDYMTLPPEEAQNPHHDVVYADTENSYKKYKGIYYPIKQDNA